MNDMAEVDRIFPAYVLNREIVCVQPQHRLFRAHYPQHLFLTSFIHVFARPGAHHLPELGLRD